MSLKPSLIVVLRLVLSITSLSASASDCPAVLDYHKRPLAEEQPVHLCEMMRGKVVLVVNTASKCAYTPQ
jgi:glutathione peroxidase